MIIRPIQTREIPLLTDFLYESIFQEDPKHPCPRTVLQVPEMFAYIDGFGSKVDDHCFVAEMDGLVIGAVWVRCTYGYGHLDDSTPEFAIALYPPYRGQGIGTQLMQTMLTHLQANGYQKTSLSVQKKNRATNLYFQLGFEVAKEFAEEYLLVYHFSTTS